MRPSRLLIAALAAMAAMHTVPAVAGHRCTDGEVISRVLIDDFEQRPGRDEPMGPVRTWARGDQQIEASVDAEGAAPAILGQRHLRLAYRLQDRDDAMGGVEIDLGGFSATGCDHFELWVKGDPEAGFASSVKVQFLRPSDEDPRMLESGSHVIKGVERRWKRFRIPLNQMSGIRDWSRLKEFRVVLQRRRTTPARGAYLLDNIAVIRTGHPGPSIDDPVIGVKKRAWEARFPSEQAIQARLRTRLRALPSRRLTDPQTLPQGGQALLTRIARDLWRGIDAMTDRENGLPVDNILIRPDGPAAQAVRVGDYTNVTNIGLYILSVVAAQDLDLITRETAISRLSRLLDTLESLETYHGFFYNYYDTVSLERTTHFISFVDSSWLTGGLMVARTAFPELAARCSTLIDRSDYGWLYDDVEQLMSHGYYTNIEYPSEYHYGMLYTESRAGSLIAIGKGDVPPIHWFRLMRALPEQDYSWQTQRPRDWRREQVNGVEVPLADYAWDGFEYIPSWGGSMFEALMPTLLVDEARYAPHSLGENDRRHVLVQQRYATAHLGYPVWGMSPSTTVGRDGYSEFGVKVLGARGYAAGVVTPHATLLALPVDPDGALANLREMIRRYAVYGDFGFYDALDPVDGRVAHKYLILDQAMAFIALANHLGNHTVQERFAADPIARKALKLIGAECFFDCRQPTRLAFRGP